MSAPVFPALAGQGWSVRKKPTFATLVASRASAREVRSALYQNPIWQFELSFDGLDGASAYGGLGPQSLQALMGLFLQCQGRYSSFLYYDPSDYQVTAQPFGTGDGTTTAFALTRTLGAFTESVTQPFAPSAPTLFQVSGQAAAYAPNNLIANSQDVTHAGWSLATMSVTSGIADPVGGAAAQTLTATAANASAANAAPATGSNYVNSVWLRRRSGTGSVFLRDPGNVNHLVTLTSSWQRFSQAAAPSGGSAPFSVTLGASGDAVDMYGPQLEQSLLATPGPYVPTLASPYYGGPIVTAAGALVDPSAYTLANGVVAFSTAPAAGTALAWSGWFGFLCRFDGDDLDFEQFMANLWRADSVKFRSLRAQ